MLPPGSLYDLTAEERDIIVEALHQQADRVAQLDGHAALEACMHLSVIALKVAGTRRFLELTQS